MPCRVDAFHSLFNCSHAKTKLFEVCRTVTVKYRDLLIKCDADSTRRKYRGFFNDSFFVVALCSCNHGSFSNELESCVGIGLLLTGHVMQGQHLSILHLTSGGSSMSCGNSQPGAPTLSSKAMRCISVLAWVRRNEIHQPESASGTVNVVVPNVETGSYKF